jgi:pantoate--beta-alanine ligase
MVIIRSVAAMQRLGLKWRAGGLKTALVPTMGYLHAGHLSLVARARRSVGAGGKVVVSIYVNPTQFAPTEDLSRYPRDFRRDTALCQSAGVDVVFAPNDHEMYPPAKQGPFSTYVIEERLARVMEGKSRPHHFRGVTTVVAKLFNIVQPGVAVFGAKDFQQAAIVQRMVRDLNFPLKLIVAPTVRERDGLAMSSRNKYLQGADRESALVLWRSLQMAREMVERTNGAVQASVLKNAVRKLVGRHRGAKLDYVEFFDPISFALVSEVQSGIQMALAVYVGKVRLIDNGVCKKTSISTQPNSR